MRQFWMLDADPECSIRVAKAGLRVCAIDISETMLCQARQRVERAGVLDAVEFHQHDFTLLDFANDSFNYAFSWGVIIHIPEAERVLDELARITKPGGKLALYLSNRTALDHKIKSFARFMSRKPLAGLQHLPLGDQRWYEKEGERLCVWEFDAMAITDYLRRKEFRLLKRRIGELSEIQRHLKGFPRQLLLRINNLAYRLSLPPSLATGNLFVFEKGHRKGITVQQHAALDKVKRAAVQTGVQRLQGTHLREQVAEGSHQ